MGKKATEYDPGAWKDIENRVSYLEGVREDLERAVKYVTDLQESLDHKTLPKMGSDIADLEKRLGGAEKAIIDIMNEMEAEEDE